MNTPTEPSNESAARQIELLRYSPMRLSLLDEIVKLIRRISGGQCLEISRDCGAFSGYLRRNGGVWHTLLSDTDAVADARALIPENVAAFTPPALPFEDKRFDLIVLVDLVENFSEYAPLIEECHRVLQPSGCIVLNVPYTGRWSPLGPLRRRLDRRRPASRDTASRREFSEENLFDLLKMGFDVIETAWYARFFSELTNLMLLSALRALPPDAPDRHDRVLRLHRIATPFFKVAFQLDYLLYPFRGNHLVALARRHAWRPRDSAVLKDAESITGAVLSKVR